MICWINSLRSPRTLPRAVATNANLELRCFLGTSIATVSSKETEPQASPIALPIARPNIWRSSLGTKLCTKPCPFIHTDNTIQAPGLGLSMEEGCRYLPVHRPYFRLHELSASSYQLRRLLGLMNRPRFVSGYATLASRVVPMRPFVGEEERELGRVKFTYYKKANKQNRSTFMYITYWRSRQAPRRLGLAINRHQSCMAREHGFDIFISANRTLVK